MGEFDSDEQRDAYVAGLKRELEYKRTAGKQVSDIEAELARVTGTPHERARTATSAKSAHSRKRSA